MSTAFPPSSLAFTNILYLHVPSLLLPTRSLEHPLIGKLMRIAQGVGAGAVVRVVSQVALSYLLLAAVLSLYPLVDADTALHLCETLM